MARGGADSLLYFIGHLESKSSIKRVLAITTVLSLAYSVTQVCGGVSRVMFLNYECSRVSWSRQDQLPLDSHRKAWKRVRASACTGTREYMLWPFLRLDGAVFEGLIHMGLVRF